MDPYQNIHTFGRAVQQSNPSKVFMIRNQWDSNKEPSIGFFYFPTPDDALNQIQQDITNQCNTGTNVNNFKFYDEIMRIDTGSHDCSGNPSFFIYYFFDRSYYQAVRNVLIISIQTLEASSILSPNVFPTATTTSTVPPQFVSTQTITPQFTSISPSVSPNSYVSLSQNTPNTQNTQNIPNTQIIQTPYSPPLTPGGSHIPIRNNLPRYSGI